MILIIVLRRQRSVSSACHSHLIRLDLKRNTHKIRDYPHLKFGRNELSIQELSFQADLKELHLSHIVKMLMEIGREFPDTKNSIIASLTSEGIDIQC